MSLLVSVLLSSLGVGLVGVLVNNLHPCYATDLSNASCVSLDDDGDVADPTSI